MYFYSAAGALFILILISFFFQKNPPQFYVTENPNSHFYIEYHNGICNITSKVRGEHGELTLPAYSTNVDLTQYTGKQKGVTGKVVRIYRTQPSSGCKLTNNQKVQAAGFRIPFFKSQFETAFIIESIATSSASHLLK